MRPSVALFAAIVAVSPARGQVVVVNFGGDYGAANQPFQPATQSDVGSFGGFDGTHDARTFVPFSTTPPQVNLAGTSGKFYGGYETINYGQGGSPGFTPPPPTFTARQVTNSGTTDFIEIATGARDATTNNGRFSGLFLWQKADFINGANNQTLGIDANSTITIKRVAGSGTIFRLTFLVEDGSTIYAMQGQSNDGSGTFIQSLANQTWAVFDPSTTMEFNGPTNGASFAPHTFTNITGVGFTWDLNGALNGGTFPTTGNDIQVPGFSATLATAVPEPSSFTLVLVAGGTVALRRRRRPGAG
jgi:PEP-CTERM motif